MFHREEKMGNNGKERWIIVANSAVARVFTLVNGNEIVEVETLVHPASRLHVSEIVSDRQGRSFESVGMRRGSPDLAIDPKKHEAVLFAKKINDYMEKMRNENRIDRLYLAASPSFLGLLRQHISDPMNQLITAMVDKDMTELKTSEIPGYFIF